MTVAPYQCQLFASDRTSSNPQQKQLFFRWRSSDGASAPLLPPIVGASEDLYFEIVSQPTALFGTELTDHLQLIDLVPGEVSLKIQPTHGIEEGVLGEAHTTLSGTITQLGDILSLAYRLGSEEDLSFTFNLELTHMPPGGSPQTFRVDPEMVVGLGG